MQQPLDWEREFTKNLRSLRLARKAWNNLKDARLDGPAKVFLYQLYAFGSAAPREVGEGLKRINSGLRNMQRAKRREGSGEKVANMVWPFKNDRVKTLADAAVTYPCIGRLPLSRARQFIGDGAQSITHYGGKVYLVPLRAWAKACGIDLSLMTLAELWDAADPSWESDPMNRKNTLQRFFALPEIQRVEKAFRSHLAASDCLNTTVFEAILQDVAT